MVDTLTQVPDVIFAGDTLDFERTLDDYPAPAWTLTYYFQNENDNFSVVATASGAIHVVSVPAATTANYKLGRFRWFARVDDGTTFTTVENGWLQILPDPTAEARDWRSHARKMVDAIEATLEGNASKQQLDLISYSFGAVNVNRDKQLLMKWRDKYLIELASESGGSSNDKRTRFVRFVSP